MTTVRADPSAAGAPVDPTALETLMCRAGLAVAVADENGCLSMLSPGLQHLLQRTFTTVPAESLAEVFHLHTVGGGRLLEPDEVPLVRASRGEVIEDAIVTVNAPGQPMRHLRVNATPVVGPHGEPQGAWAVATDVTGLVAAARGELNRTLAETVNHSLRTPLTTMLCHAELLLDLDDDLSPEVTRSLQSLWRAGQRLKDVVSSISGWIDLARAPVDTGARVALAERTSFLKPPATLDHVGTASPTPVELTRAIDLVDDGVLGLDHDLRVRFVNETAARLLGREAGALRGTDLREVFPPASGSIFDHRYHEALASQQRAELQTYVAALDTWVSISLHPSLAGTTTILRDVTGDRSLAAARRTFADRLVQAEDRERARIAADVHEDSLQALGAVARQLQVLHAHLPASPPPVQSFLDGLDRQVSEATQRLRDLLFRLEPTCTDAPTAQSIRTQAAHIFDGTAVHWSVDDIDAGEDLAPAERSQALRIIKEALSNVRAHAQASEVIVTIRGHEGGVEIEVCDNGPATDAALFSSALGHRGLQTMRDRAADFGGRCTIESTSPQGCTVRLYLPRLRTP